jgi:hypothetical protein
MTIDMTNNRVPYGLLTDEEKAALHEHEKVGGVVQHHQANTWFNCAPSWLHNVIYRTVPLPKTQDVIAWDRLPGWVEWVARNNSGGVWAYQKEPSMLSIMWDNVSGDFRRIDDFPGIVQIGTCDWEDSKQRRPK